MYKRHEIGKKGEELAVQYLIDNGYKIIERNYECNQGEIDIISKYKNEIVFIEVKSRTNEIYGKPKDAVNIKKKQHIYNSAEYYIYSKHLENNPVRIDVIEIYKKNNIFKINHIKQAITERPTNKR